MVLVFGRRWRPYLGRKYPGTLDRGTDIYRVRPDVGVTILAGPGAPFAGMVVEELSAIGVARFVIVGLAGSLQSRVRVGDIVLCERALRDEGTSFHYLAPGKFVRPSPELTRRLRTTIERARVPFVAGTSWTIDAPYRETVEEIRRYRARGILTVEMEASAVFTIARLRRRQAGAIFVISDHLDERGWEPRFHDCRRPLRKALGLAVDSFGH